MTFSSKQVTQLAKLNPGRCSAGVQLYRNDVYVFGGFNDVKLSLCHEYNIKDNTWSDLPNLPEAIDWGTTAVFKNCIYITGYHVNILAEFNLKDKTFGAITYPSLSIS